MRFSPRAASSVCLHFTAHREDPAQKSSFSTSPASSPNRPSCPLFGEHELTALTRQQSPDPSAVKLHDGRHPAHHGLGDVIEGGLAGGATSRLSALAVYCVLDHIQVEAGAHLDGAELHQLLGHTRGSCTSRTPLRSGLYRLGTAHGPTIHHHHVGRRHQRRSPD